jgi:hypothetical protein
MGCPMTPGGRSECAQLLIDKMAALGSEITVSTALPLVVGPYGINGYTCPHGVTYWIEPTGEQIAAWVKDGVP